MSYFVTCQDLAPQYSLFNPTGAITPIIDWPHYGDHGLAPLRRSSGGSITAIIKWHYSSDH
jgi:hypothetical protein